MSKTYSCIALQGGRDVLEKAREICIGLGCNGYKYDKHFLKYHDDQNRMYLYIANGAKWNNSPMVMYANHEFTCDKVIPVTLDNVEEEVKNVVNELKIMV